jgi:hypothetical protein
MNAAKSTTSIRLLTFIHPSIYTMSQNNENYTQQNPNGMPRRDPPKAPETIEYICGGTLE